MRPTRGSAVVPAARHERPDERAGSPAVPQAQSASDARGNGAEMPDRRRKPGNCQWMPAPPGGGSDLRSPRSNSPLEGLEDATCSPEWEPVRNGGRGRCPAAVHNRISTSISEELHVAAQESWPWIVNEHDTGSERTV